VEEFEQFYSLFSNRFEGLTIFECERYPRYANIFLENDLKDGNDLIDRDDFSCLLQVPALVLVAV
jgi:hypothetical protein